MFSADAIEGSMRDLDIALTITRKSQTNIILSPHANVYLEVSVKLEIVA